MNKMPVRRVANQTTAHTRKKKQKRKKKLDIKNGIRKHTHTQRNKKPNIHGLFVKLRNSVG